VRDDRRTGHAQSDHPKVLRRFGARELLEIDGLVAPPLTCAAVLLWPGEPGVPGRCKALAPVASEREDGGAVPAPETAQPGGHVRLEPRPQRRAEGGFLGSVAEIHQALRSPTSGGRGAISAPMRTSERRHSSSPASCSPSEIGAALKSV